MTRTFVSTVHHSVPFTHIESSLQSPPLYNGQLILPASGCCREILPHCKRNCKLYSRVAQELSCECSNTRVSFIGLKVGNRFRFYKLSTVALLLWTSSINWLCLMIFFNDQHHKKMDVHRWLSSSVHRTYKLHLQVRHSWKVAFNCL